MKESSVEKNSDYSSFLHTKDQDTLIKSYKVFKYYFPELKIIKLFVSQCGII